MKWAFGFLFFLLFCYLSSLVAQENTAQGKSVLDKWLQNLTAKYVLAEEPSFSREKEQKEFIRGQEVFSRSCVGCHQQSGQGLVGSFPPLVGHVPNIVNSKNGKEYLIDVVLYGLEGPIQVDTQQYN